eukprot:8371122-Lingulodinium_polyedra.AAC.1
MRPQDARNNKRMTSCASPLRCGDELSKRSLGGCHPCCRHQTCVEADPQQHQHKVQHSHTEN